MQTTDFGTILLAAWQIMNTEFTVYGLTTSYADLFLYSLLAGLFVTAVCIFFRIRG